MNETSGNLALKPAPEWKPRTELINGKVVAMSPRPATNHNRAAWNIYGIFRDYLRGRPCEPFADGEDLYLTDMDHYIPDMMVVCDQEKVKPNGVYGAPDLVVEVLSPGTALNDRTRKMETYQRCGVREYWIVSPGDVTVEQYVLEEGKFVLQEIYTLYDGYMLEHMEEEDRAAVVSEFHCTLFDDLTIRLADIFERVV